MKSFIEYVLTILVLITNSLAYYDAQCPSWALRSYPDSYAKYECVNYDGINYYAASLSGTEYLPTQINITENESFTDTTKFSGLYDHSTTDLYDIWSGWVACNALPDSARQEICEKNYVYCADVSSGLVVNDTIYIRDTLKIVDSVTVKDTIRDTVYTNVNKYDTIYISVYDTNSYVVDLFDTTIFLVNEYDTNLVDVVLYDTTIVSVLDTTHKDVFIYDTILSTIYDTITTKIYHYDTLERDFVDTMYLTVEVPKIAEIKQGAYTESPKLVTFLDSTLFDLTDDDVVVIEYRYYIYDNLGQYVYDTDGCDTIYYKGVYNNVEHDLFYSTEIGMLAKNGKRLATGVYIIQGYYKVYLNGEYKYRDFTRSKYGFKR